MGYENPVKTQRKDSGFSEKLRKKYLKPALVKILSSKVWRQGCSYDFGYFVGYCEAADDQWPTGLHECPEILQFYREDSTELLEWTSTLDPHLCYPPPPPSHATKKICPKLRAPVTGQYRTPF